MAVRDPQHKLSAQADYLCAGPERNGSSTRSLPQGDSPEAVVVREVVSLSAASLLPNSS